MKTKNQRIAKHGIVAANYHRLAEELEWKIRDMKKLIRSRKGNPMPTLDETLQMSAWSKSATEYREEERRHRLTQRICGDEFVLVRKTSY